MSVAFRNVDVSSSDPVATWPTEAVQAALERGGLTEWRRLALEIRERPWGRTARRVEEVLTHSRPYGAAELMESALAHARDRAERIERAQVAEEIRTLIRETGLTQAAFASAIGTSASRLSTYVNGTVVPSATLVVRMRGVASRDGGPARAPIPG
ncbi:MAG: helix-turn-helix domain-containing protein [Solirubrobacteraceae bacterium]